LLAKKYERMIGENLKDPYGRFLGIIVGFSTDNRNQISKIAVENRDGSFVEHGVDRLIIEDSVVIQRPEWKVDSEELRREAEVSKRRMSALENLYSAGKVSARTYQELSEEYRKVLRSQEEERQRLIDLLEERNGELSRQIALLERLLADTEVQHITGELTDNAFRTASLSLRSGIDRALQEKREVEIDLEALQLLDATVELSPQPAVVPEERPIQQSPSVPQPPAIEAVARQAPTTSVQQASTLLSQLVTSWKPPSQQTTDKEKPKESKPESPLVLRL
jgi:DNA-directed RNA polymerase subunit F